MAIFVPNKNVESNESFGRTINQIRKDFLDGELSSRGSKGFAAALIEIPRRGAPRVEFDGDVRIEIQFKKKKVSPSDVGKNVTVELDDLRDVGWARGELSPHSAGILLIRFSKDWWILKADFKNRGALEEKYRATRTFKVRGGGYLPLDLRKKERPQFVEEWKKGLDKELAQMWRRYLTTTQNYRGTMSYDGNYFDLFQHAQNLYILGHYFASTIVSRIAAEQALVAILAKSGKGLDAYEKKKSGERRLKRFSDLVDVCRDKKNFPKKLPINKTAEKKLRRVANAGNDLVHLRTELDSFDSYKRTAKQCMDDVNYAIRRHLNFVKDTGVVSGYRFSGAVKRLK